MCLCANNRLQASCLCANNSLQASVASAISSYRHDACTQIMGGRHRTPFGVLKFKRGRGGVGDAGPQKPL